MEHFEALYNSLQYQENECVELISKSLLTDLVRKKIFTVKLVGVIDIINPGK